MLEKLPTVIADLVCSFAFCSTYSEMKRSLRIILDLQQHYIHPYVRAHRVGDYALVDDSWYYDKRTMGLGLLAPYCVGRESRQSPFESFFVWFAFVELWNIPKISRVLFDLDWRKVNWIRAQTGFRDRESLLFWIATTTDGVVYCSQMFTRLKLHMLKKYPATVSRYLVCDNFDEWTAYII